MIPSNDPAIVRRAAAADAPAILDLIDALADYEKLKRPTQEARERLVRDICGATPRVDALLAFVDDRPVGYAIIFETYSTFLASPTLYLEDLFVLPEYRGRKVGYALFDEVKQEAVRRSCGRIEWTVLDWNQLAIDFYKRLGGEHMKQWQLFRITL
jgi:GNAT superfamily N-acetyltransferase